MPVLQEAFRHHQDFLMIFRWRFYRYRLSAIPAIIQEGGSNQ